MSELLNGARVYRVWSDDSFELLAEFQYWKDAEMFAKRCVQSDFYIGCSDPVQLAVVGQGCETGFLIVHIKKETADV